MKAALDTSLPADHAGIAAEGMLRNFGLDASARAQHMASRCASRRDGVGEAMWIEIGRRISELRSKSASV